jgi:sulfopyruvate decarboxylase alpha subunit
MADGSLQDIVRARSDALIAGLEDVQVQYVLHLPSSTLKHIIAHFTEHSGVRTFPLTREEEGIGIAAGLALGGARPILILQDNGLGNALTALTTFPQAYHIPLLLLVSQRGGLNEYNSMIHTFCEHVPDILSAARLRHFQLDARVPVAQWRPTVVKTYEYAQITHRPVVLLCNLMGF